MLRGSRQANPDLVPWEEFRYVQYAREFGWTPNQVDEISLTIEPWLLPINEAIEAEINRRTVQARQEAEAKAKKGR